MSAAAVAGTTGNAQAMLRFSNPPGMSTPPTYSHAVEVNGPHRTVYREIEAIAILPPKA